MMMAMDKELMLGRIKKEKSAASFFNGTGMGMVISCLYSPYSPKRTIFIVIGLIMLGIGWYKRSKYEKDILSFIENE